MAKRSIERERLLEESKREVALLDTAMEELQVELMASGAVPTGAPIEPRFAGADRLPDPGALFEGLCRFVAEMVPMIRTGRARALVPFRVDEVTEPSLAVGLRNRPDGSFVKRVFIDCEPVGWSKTTKIAVVVIWLMYTWERFGIALSNSWEQTLTTSFITVRSIIAMSPKLDKAFDVGPDPTNPRSAALVRSRTTGSILIPRTAHPGSDPVQNIAGIPFLHFAWISEGCAKENPQILTGMETALRGQDGQVYCDSTIGGHVAQMVKSGDRPGVHVHRAGEPLDHHIDRPEPIYIFYRRFGEGQPVGAAVELAESGRPPWGVPGEIRTGYALAMSSGDSETFMAKRLGWIGGASRPFPPALIEALRDPRAGKLPPGPFRDRAHLEAEVGATRVGIGIDRATGRIDLGSDGSGLGVVARAAIPAGTPQEQWNGAAFGPPEREPEATSDAARQARAERLIVLARIPLPNELPRAILQIVKEQFQRWMPDAMLCDLQQMFDLAFELRLLPHAPRVWAAPDPTAGSKKVALGGIRTPVITDLVQGRAFEILQHHARARTLEICSGILDATGPLGTLRQQFDAVRKQTTPRGAVWSSERNEPDHAGHRVNDDELHAIAYAALSIAGLPLVVVPRHPPEEFFAALGTVSSSRLPPMFRDRIRRDGRFDV